MKIAAVKSSLTGPVEGMAEVATALGLDRQGRPDFVAIHFGAGCPAEELRSVALSRLGTKSIHGGTSCLGIMTQSSLGIEHGAEIGALAIWDPEGSYGTASANLDEDAVAAAITATNAALVAAGRVGEMPDLIWLTVAPGREELVLAGIRSVVGDETLIVGGSSADNDVSGKWSQFGPMQSHVDGVVVSVLFPSEPVTSTYQSGYAPTQNNGIVTRVTGRRLHEIDGHPAAAVYHRWTQGAVPLAAASSQSVLAAATLWPLGRVTRQIAGVPFHLLAHPAVAHSDGSLDLFADVTEGDRLWQMTGSADSLVARAGSVARQACEEAGGQISGALVVYCGGCMMAVRDRMDEVRHGITTALGEVPWLGVFTFGEQGVPSGSRPSHGNLMISCTVFGSKR